MFVLLFATLWCNCSTPIQNIQCIEIQNAASPHVPELAPGKTFFSGDELQAVTYVKGANTLIDSLSYSLYEDTAGRFFVFALEKLIRWDDVEKYQILDTVMIQDDVDSSAIVMQAKYTSNEQILNLSVNGQLRKTWRFPILPLPANFNQRWAGEYNHKIDYGKIDSFSEAAVFYIIGTYPDSCVFYGIGYKTDFMYICRLKIVGDTAFLYFIRPIEETIVENHSSISELARIIYRSNRYFVKSPLIESSDEGIEFLRKRK